MGGGDGAGVVGHDRAMSRLRRTACLLVGSVVAIALITFALDRDADHRVATAQSQAPVAQEVRERIPEVSTAKPVPMGRVEVAEPWRSKLGETPKATAPTSLDPKLASLLPRGRYDQKLFRVRKR